MIGDVQRFFAFLTPPLLVVVAYSLMPLFIIYVEKPVHFRIKPSDEAVLEIASFTMRYALSLAIASLILIFSAFLTVAALVRARNKIERMRWIGALAFGALLSGLVVFGEAFAFHPSRETIIYSLADAMSAANASTCAKEGIPVEDLLRYFGVDPCFSSVRALFEAGDRFIWFAAVFAVSVAAWWPAIASETNGQASGAEENLRRKRVKLTRAIYFAAFVFSAVALIISMGADLPSHKIFDSDGSESSIAFSEAHLQLVGRYWGFWLSAAVLSVYLVSQVRLNEEATALATRRCGENSVAVRAWLSAEELSDDTTGNLSRVTAALSPFLVGQITSGLGGAI